MGEVRDLILLGRIGIDQCAMGMASMTLARFNVHLPCVVVATGDRALSGFES